MRLRPGVTARRAMEALRELAQAAENKRGPVGPDEDGIRKIRDGYLVWVEGAERQLRSLLVEPDLIASLLSERYWRIQELDRYSARPYPLIEAEIETQSFRFREVADLLESFLGVAERAGGVMLLDTNVFMHCELFTQIDWCKEFDSETVRLVVPLVVLDELDDKTFSPNKLLGRRADSVLRAFDQRMDDIVAHGCADVRPNVTLEVFRDEDDHRRRANNDTEALDRAVFLQQVIERQVTVITADRGCTSPWETARSRDSLYARSSEAAAG